MEWLAPAPLSLSLLHFPFLLSNSFPPVSSLSGSTPPSPFSLSRLSFSTGELVSRACHASTEVKTVRFSFSRPFPRHFFFSTEEINLRGGEKARATGRSSLGARASRYVTASRKNSRRLVSRAQPENSG